MSKEEKLISEFLKFWQKPSIICQINLFKNSDGVLLVSALLDTDSVKKIPVRPSIVGKKFSEEIKKTIKEYTGVDIPVIVDLSHCQDIYDV